MKRQSYLLYLNILMLVASVTLISLFLLQNEWYILLLGYGAAAVFSVGSVVFYLLRRTDISKILFILNVLVLFIVALLSALTALGILDTLSDMERLREIILSAGSLGYLIYSLLLILNVVVLPLPGFILPLVGVAIYGPLVAAIITYICYVVGSVISFFIGRVFGRRAVVWCVGEETTEKYTSLLGAKGSLLFIIVQLLPFFPDDILCMVAGLTNMKFSFLISAMLILKPFYILPVCYLGTGLVIPFSGWGIPVWILIIAFFGAAFFLFCKYQERIERWFSAITHKKSK